MNKIPSIVLLLFGNKNKYFLSVRKTLSFTHIAGQHLKFVKLVGLRQLLLAKYKSLHALNNFLV